MIMKPETTHVKYIHKETHKQKKKRVNQLRSIFRHFLKAEDKRIAIIAERFEVDFKVVLTAITEGLNKGWR